MTVGQISLMNESTVFLNDVGIQLPPLQEINAFLTFAYTTFPRVIDLCHSEE